MTINLYGKRCHFRTLYLFNPSLLHEERQVIGFPLFFLLPLLSLLELVLFNRKQLVMFYKQEHVISQVKCKKL